MKKVLSKPNHVQQKKEGEGKGKDEYKFVIDSKELNVDYWINNLVYLIDIKYIIKMGDNYKANSWEKDREYQGREKILRQS